MAQAKAALHAACLGLKDTINAALEAAGLSCLTGDIEQEPLAQSTNRPKPPRLSVTLAGDRTIEQPAPGSEVEQFPVTWRLEVDGTEATCAAYEDVVTETLEGVTATLQAAMPSGVTLHLWELTGGVSDIAGDRMNRDCWQVDISFRVTMEW